MTNGMKNGHVIDKKLKLIFKYQESLFPVLRYVILTLEGERLVNIKCIANGC